MQKVNLKKTVRPGRQQKRPGQESAMVPEPVFDSSTLGTHQKLKGKVALITGGDSGIGRSVAVAFARQGAEVAIAHLPSEKADAKETVRYILQSYGRKCLLVPGDISLESHCKVAVKTVVAEFGKIDILVNNAGLHYPVEDILHISAAQLEKTFRVNVFAMFYLVKASLPYMEEGSSIINTASVTAYRGSGHLIDYSATKGAIVSFTRSLAASLVDKKIRVNAVAPGPVWTPLIASSMKPEEIKTFGTDSPMGRAGQPVEISPCYVFLAADDSSFITGQVLHPNGGEIVNG